jgi:hypothetical protein
MLVKKISIQWLNKRYLKFWTEPYVLSNYFLSIYYPFHTFTIY